MLFQEHIYWIYCNTPNTWLTIMILDLLLDLIHALLNGFFTNFIAQTVKQFIVYQSIYSTKSKHLLCVTVLSPTSAAANNTPQKSLYPCWAHALFKFELSKCLYLPCKHQIWCLNQRGGELWVSFWSRYRVTYTSYFVMNLNSMLILGN